MGNETNTATTHKTPGQTGTDQEVQCPRTDTGKWDEEDEEEEESGQRLSF